VGIVTRARADELGWVDGGTLGARRVKSERERGKRDEGSAQHGS
jgi:hypothetical protein